MAATTRQRRYSEAVVKAAEEADANGVLDEEFAHVLIDELTGEVNRMTVQVTAAMGMPFI